MNSQAPLPAALPAGGLSCILSLYVGDDLNANANRIDNVTLRMRLSGVKAQIGEVRREDIIEAKFNGILLAAPVEKSDGFYNWHTFTLTPRHFAVGENLISIRLANWSPQALCYVVVEKVEVSVDYKE